MKKKPLRICFDIDGVIADGTVGDVYSDAVGWAYDKCTPITSTVDIIRRLYKNGIEIYLHTARPVRDQLKTIRWLNAHGVPFDHLSFDKPLADLYVDDRNYPTPYVATEPSMDQYLALLKEAERHAGKRDW